jgi:hypothetical protein
MGILDGLGDALRSQLAYIAQTDAQNKQNSLAMMQAGFAPQQQGGQGLPQQIMQAFMPRQLGAQDYAPAPWNPQVAADRRQQEEQRFNLESQANKERADSQQAERGYQFEGARDLYRGQQSEKEIGLKGNQDIRLEQQREIGRKAELNAMLSNAMALEAQRTSNAMEEERQKQDLIGLNQYQRGDGGAGGGGGGGAQDLSDLSGSASAVGEILKYHLADLDGKQLGDLLTVLKSATDGLEAQKRSIFRGGGYKDNAQTELYMNLAQTVTSQINQLRSVPQYRTIVDTYFGVNSDEAWLQEAKALLPGAADADMPADHRFGAYGAGAPTTFGQGGGFIPPSTILQLLRSRSAAMPTGVGGAAATLSGGSTAPAAPAAPRMRPQYVEPEFSGIPPVPGGAGGFDTYGRRPTLAEVLQFVGPEGLPPELQSLSDINLASPDSTRR